MVDGAGEVHIMPVVVMCQCVLGFLCLRACASALRVLPLDLMWWSSTFEDTDIREES